ncbi:MAG: hypothetical protein WBV22_07110 [Anaerolineaceae bacterium]
MRSALKTFVPYLVIVAIALIGFVNVLFATRGGIGAQSDSAFYVGVARNLAAGHGLGLTRPFTGFEFFSIFPPLYSLILAGLAASGFDLIEAARWMNALLFGLTISLAGGFFIWRWKSSFAGTLVAALIAFSPSMIAAHAWLLSEPLYYFLGTISLLALIIFLTGQRWTWLVLSACAAALAALDRYAGLALVICGLITLLFQPSSGITVRIKRLVVFGLISLVPTGIWLWVARIQSSTIAGRELFTPDQIVPRLVKLIGPLKQTIISWVPFSDVLPFISDPHHYKPFWIIAILVVISLAILLLAAIRRGNKNGILIASPVYMLCVFCLFMACHLLVFAGATLFLSSSPAAGDRNFAPLLFSFYFLLSASMVIILRTFQDHKRIRITTVVIAVILIGGSMVQGVKTVAAYPADGLGYNTRSERQSPIYDAIRKLPEDLLIVCNNPNVILFHTNRGTYPIVELYTQNPEWDFPVYGQGRNHTDQGQLAFEQGRAALVLLPDAYWEVQLVYDDKIDRRMAGLIKGLYVYYDGYDGEIYLKDESVLNN